MIATARILMPRRAVRLSAGRTELSREAQLLCIYAGANSIFYGDKLLTTPNPGPGRGRGPHPRRRARQNAASSRGELSRGNWTLAS